jgi:hypothetical protein
MPTGSTLHFIVGVPVFGNPFPSSLLFHNAEHPTVFYFYSSLATYLPSTPLSPILLVHTKGDWKRQRQQRSAKSPEIFNMVQKPFHGCLALFAVGCAAATQTSPPRHGPWSLPTLTSSTRQPGSTFMDECTSLATCLGRVRGGSSSDDAYGRKRAAGGGYDGDDSNDDEDYPDDHYYGQTGSRPGGNNDYYDSGDRGATPQASIFQSIPSIIKKGDRRIGLSLLASGTVVTMLGMSLFFNKALMRLGNLLFIAGVPVTLGPTRTAGYFLQADKMRATACLGVGIFLVLVGSPVFGIALEIFGLLNLFGNMFPVILAIAKQLPVVGPMLSGNNKNNGGHRNSNRGHEDEDRGRYNSRGYEDDYYERGNSDQRDGSGRRDDYNNDGYY